MGGWREWRSSFIDYISSNVGNQYTDDISLDDSVILFKEDSGAGQSDRPATLQEIVTLFQATVSTNLYNIPFKSLSGKDNGEVPIGNAISVVVAKLVTGTTGSFKVGFTDGGEEIIRSYELNLVTKPFKIISIPDSTESASTTAYTVYVEVSGTCTMDIYVSTIKFI